MTQTLDDTDRKILDLLQRDARMTNAAIGAEVGMTAPSVFERIRKLEQRGVIKGYTAVVNPAALGKAITAFIRLTAAWDERHEPGIAEISRDPDVLELYNVAGEDCFILKTRVDNPEQLEALLQRIRSRITVQRSVTMIAMSAIKENAPLKCQTASDKLTASPANVRPVLAVPTN
jgi:Lrp/AsnC family transcriptional regulator, leucine-responsive regulatory protein